MSFYTTPSNVKEVVQNRDGTLTIEFSDGEVFVAQPALNSLKETVVQVIEVTEEDITEYELDRASDGSPVLAWVNGSLAPITGYTVVDTTLTLSSALTTGDILTVYYTAVPQAV